MTALLEVPTFEMLEIAEELLGVAVFYLPTGQPRQLVTRLEVL